MTQTAFKSDLTRDREGVFVPLISSSSSVSAWTFIKLCWSLPLIGFVTLTTKAHGRIAVKSVPNQGSIFTLRKRRTLQSLWHGAVCHAIDCDLKSVFDRSRFQTQKGKKFDGTTALSQMLPRIH